PVIGQRFGNYRAVSLLGEGGMGAVYLAEHPDIGRRVAVKVLRAEMIKDPQLLQRFLNEARAANAIRHPNIIEILDSGSTIDGTPYLVMELLEGEVLSSRIRRQGRLPLADALEFAYQAASALAAAHEKAIIHRDLKPDNLFLIPDPNDPSRERVKVLDFGIAKLQTFPTGGGMQTRTGTLMGTPVYMSPEQCLGTKTIDARSDIYAMGIIMFEMLSGRPPFLSEGFGELVNMHLNVRPPPLRDINAAIPQSVEALVAKALEKSPEARHRSAAELQIDIRAAAGKSIVIRGASSPDLMSETLAGVTAGSTRVLPQSTTMTTGTGERLATTMPVRRPSGARRLLLGAIVLACAAGGAALVVSRRDPQADKNGGDRAAGTSTATKAVVAGAGGGGSASAALGTAAIKESAPVRVAVESRPSGASVTDVESGRPLGATPLVVERPASQGPVTIRLEKTGFASLTRALDLDRDRTETISLVALPPEKPERPEKVKKAPGSRPHHPVARPDDEPAKL
ncbi:MAG: serine/threonine-protein kinase, partial [Verrucomicrobiota bacterium]